MFIVRWYKKLNIPHWFKKLSHLFDWYKNLNILPKLLSGFTSVALVALVIGLVALASLQQISQKYMTLYDKNGRAQVLTYQIQAQFQFARGSMRDAVLGMLTSAYDLKKHQDNTTAACAKMDELLPQLQQVLDQEDQNQYRKLLENYTSFKEGSVEVYATIMKGKNKDSIDLMRKLDSTYAQNVNDAVGFLAQYGEESGAKAMVSIDKSTRTTELVIIIVTALLFLLTLTVGYLLAVAMSKPLRTLKNNALKLAQGDFNLHMDIQRKDEVGVLSTALESVVGSIQRLTADISGLTEAAVQGRLQARADVGAHQGEYRRVIEGVNTTLDAVVLPVAMAANYVERISMGDIPEPITDEYNGEFNTLKDNLNTCIAAIKRLVDDANHLSDAAVRGELTVRADADAHQGDFQRVVAGFNATLDALVSPLTVAADYVARISRGHIPEPITEEYQGEFNTLKDNLNTCIASINGLVDSARSLSAAAVRGELDMRADTSGMRGDFRRVMEGVNATLDALVGPLTMAADTMARISHGDIPEPITGEYNGQFNTIKDNLNTCIAAVNRLIEDTDALSCATVRGELDVRADADAHQGDFRRVIEGVNATLDAVINPLGMAASYVERISQGDLPELITDEYQGQFNTIKNNLNTCIQNIRALCGQTEQLTSAAQQELFDTRGDADAFAGAYAQIVSGINATLDVVVERIFWYESLLNSIPLHICATGSDERLMFLNDAFISSSALQDVAYKGCPRSDFVQNDNLEQFRAGLTRTHHADQGRHYVTDVSAVRSRDGQQTGYVEVIQDVTGDTRRTEYLQSEVAKLGQDLALLAQGNLSLSYTAAEGDEYTQSERESFRSIERDLSAAMGTLRGYVGEIAQMLGAMAEGDLSAREVPAYMGDFGGISDALNSILTSFNTLFSEMRVAADQVASGAHQVSDGSQALSQGATEQASAIEMLTASLGEVATQTKQNAMDANRASDLSSSARDHALDGDSHMKQMQQSMKEINASSASISRVIKVIDDIAFQTNLLALNAAVEAAHAGQHGKGFAVVAEEVRNLAVRSANAAKETTVMIESSIQKAAEGTRIADSTAQALAKIVTGVEEATGIVGGIASASRDQATAVAQINRGVEQVSQVVQTNSATAEQSAAASEELSGQAETLKAMVARFRLRQSEEPRSAAALPGGRETAKPVRRKISLNDKEFGKY